MATLKFEDVSPEAYAKFCAWVDKVVGQPIHQADLLKILKADPANMLVNKPLNIGRGWIESRIVSSVVCSSSGRNRLTVEVEIMDWFKHLTNTNGVSFERVAVPASYLLKAASLLGKFPPATDDLVSSGT